MNPRILIALAACLALAACTDRTPETVEPQNVRPAKLMTIVGKGGDVTYEFTGRIEALRSIDLSFEVDGNLAEVAALEGATVSTGTLVAALDPTEFELAVQEAEAQFKLSALDLERKRLVLAENGIAKSVVEDAQAFHELQRVRLHQQRERLADTRLRAPFDAYVSKRHLDPHVNVKTGDPVLRLHDLRQLQVVMSAPEALVATLSPAQLARAWVVFSFAPGQEFDITYHENRGEADALAQTYEVAFIMQSPQSLRILPGMTATVHLRVRKPGGQRILVPASALAPMPSGDLAVWVYDEATTKVMRRRVVTDAPIAEGVPIVQGLTDGERIVIAGASQLSEGMRVRPLE